MKNKEVYLLIQSYIIKFKLTSITIRIIKFWIKKIDFGILIENIGLLIYW